MKSLSSISSIVRQHSYLAMPDVIPDLDLYPYDPWELNGGGKKVGMKKHFVFYVGEAPAGIKTNWTMQEYRLSDSGSTSRSSKRRGPPKIDYSTWVLCRVYERNCDDDDDDDDGTELSCLDEVFLSLDDLDEVSLPN
ncbi:hypothetical protein L1049_014614 [Liquidambar formosana]|uniref:NAC domain-containing protein n=1 Tax=Liquidambar formosana TaxID=63359 RepID=A0AAP0RXG7_LIQFO